MTDSNAEPVPADRSGRKWIGGTAILAILTGLLAFPGRRRPAGVETAYFIGQIAGTVIAPALFAVIIYAVVRAFNRNRPKARSAKITFWILFVWFVLVLAALLGRATTQQTASAQNAFTPAQRQGLQIDTDSIRHPSLGFALPNPGPRFVRNYQIEQQMASQFGGRVPEDFINWAFHDSTAGQILMIQVTGYPGLNEEMFRDVTRGIKKGATRSNAKVVSEASVWDDTHREARVTLQHPNGLYVVMRCVPSLRRGQEFVVCAHTFSANPNDLAMVRDGLTVAK